MKKHWLYGEGKNRVLHFNVEIDAETDCGYCEHRKVCGYEMHKRCSNFDLGCSGDGCQGCHHQFTRYDKEPVPCFHCEDFLDARIL